MNKEAKRNLTSKPSSEKTLRDWFARKGGEGSSSGWVDCNTCRKGKCKPCGRKKGEKRKKYPACRPTPAACKKYKKTKGKSWGKKSKSKSKKRSSEIRSLMFKSSEYKHLYESEFENEFGNEINIKIEEVSDRNKNQDFDAVSIIMEGPDSLAENIITYSEANKLEEALSEFLSSQQKEESNIKTAKKKRDPKTGTGKKPKGSGRRLYTDENPKDTCKVSFTSASAIRKTFSSSCFKSKPHARQSQIINLVHQRVRAAYNNAKDPKVKARLKRAYEYAKKRKESSKKKTERLKKKKN